MKRRVNYPMKSYLSPRTKAQAQAQSSIEFSIALVCAVLFLFLSCNLFVWLNHNIVQRQKAYKETRLMAGRGSKVSDGAVTGGEPGKLNFYCQGDDCYIKQKNLNVFVPGGYE